jgi:hypothetical protein
VAETMVRMHGWQVESFPEFQVYHYRCTGTANANLHKARFRDGKKEYVLGYHPLFLIAQCIFRATKRRTFPGPTFRPAPLLRMLGYFWAFCRRYKRPVPDDFVKYLRSEQLSRLRSILFTGKDSALRV